MHIVRRIVGLLGLATIFGASVLVGPAASATSAVRVEPGSAQATAAQHAAQWLAGQLSSNGTIPGATAGTVDLSATVNTILALGVTSADHTAARRGLTYLEAHSEQYIEANGSDGPGQLANLIMAAHLLGVAPTHFGSTDLVSRLEATAQTTGRNLGRFGTDAQVKDYNSGPYDQGLALAALQAAGVAAATDEVTWLAAQQCPNGGWTAPSKSANPCSGNPADFAGPDTNTTSLAIQGLAAQGGLTSAVTNKALAFLTRAQDPDAGWGYDPNTASSPGTTDPDSTSLVMQGLLAMGKSPTAAQFTKGSATPLSAALGFVVTSGSDTGAISSPFGSPTTGNILATYQTVPALAYDAFPFDAPASPTVTGLKPDSGPNTGGTSVTLTGTGFRGVTGVSFGSAPATFTVTSLTRIVATSPSTSNAGPVDVTVTTLGGPSPSSLDVQFTYQATPTPASSS
jgi:hypothetical protein